MRELVSTIIQEFRFEAFEYPKEKKNIYLFYLKEDSFYYFEKEQKNILIVI